ncbi:MAG: SPFH domain-containing protein [Planctomycetota bacterium]|nr:SPFH domain-containing protein [Planctomycetota bacterium]MDA1261324.1 SPFH domain-containing protein [Planctomycetota bacterium]
MIRKIPIIIASVIVLVLVLFNTTYTVNFHEIAVLTRFGKPAGVQRDPGLHLKAPLFIDQVTKLDARLQFIESPLETVLTKDGQQVLVQAYLLWRVEDSGDAPLQFFISYGNLEAAGKELETQLQGAVRSVGGYNFSDLIGQGSKIAEAESAILNDLRSTKLAGIDPVSVGISQIVLPPKTTVAVLRRMAAVQETLANLEEAKGNSEAEAIKSLAASSADTIRNFAAQWASEIESLGNEEATRYYQLMKQEADLAIFLTWLDTLKASLSGSTTFVTDLNRAPFHLLDLSAPSGSTGIPQPKKPYVVEAPQDGATGKGAP